MKRAAGAGLALIGTLIAAVPVAAQQGDDFLFERPNVTILVRGGFLVPRADGAIFDDARSFFTLETSDFRAFTLGGEVSVRVDERVDVALGVSFSESRSDSEYEHFMGTDNLPIVQTTELEQVPVTLSAKYFLVDRGRSVGSYAWIPSAVAPYVGGGVGVVWYRYAQEGEFVDFETLDIFFDELSSEDASASGHVLAGVEVSLGPRFLLNGEGRYTWASAPAEGDFRAFEDVDLNGFQASFGVGVRF